MREYLAKRTPRFYAPPLTDGLLFQRPAGIEVSFQPSRLGAPARPASDPLRYFGFEVLDNFGELAVSAAT